MDRITDLGRCEPPFALASRGLLLGEPDDSLRVEPVRAALEERERAVGELPHDPCGRLRKRRQGWQLRLVGFIPVRQSEELELLRRCPSDRLQVRRPPVDAEKHDGAVDLELASAVDVKSGSDPVHHPSDGRPRSIVPGRIERPGQNQAIDRACHRNVVEAPRFVRLGSRVGTFDFLVPEGIAMPSRDRIGNAEPEAPIRQAEDLLGALGRPGRRPASHTTTTRNSRPFAA